MTVVALASVNMSLVTCDNPVSKKYHERAGTQDEALSQIVQRSQGGAQHSLHVVTGSIGADQ